MSGTQPVVTAEWLAENRHHVVVADVRWYLDGRSGRDAYDAGHIPGARFVDLDRDLSDPPTPARGRHPLPDARSFADAMGRLGIGDAATVVAYDDAGGVVAARLWWMLDAIGMPASVLDGGIDAWTGPIETAEPRWEPVQLTARAWPADRIASVDEVADARTRPGSVLLDARPAERFRGDDNPIDTRFGHIPGAISRPATDNLDDGRLRSPRALRAAFEELGAHTSSVIAYCGSGVSACHDLLAMRVAGLPDARLFVGSWSMWSSDPDRPVETG